jgi:hypothetical protein
MNSINHLELRKYVDREILLNFISGVTEVAIGIAIALRLGKAETAYAPAKLPVCLLDRI